MDVIRHEIKCHLSGRWMELTLISHNIKTTCLSCHMVLGTGTLTVNTCIVFVGGDRGLFNTCSKRSQEQVIGIGSGDFGVSYYNAGVSYGVCDDV